MAILPNLEALTSPFRFRPKLVDCLRAGYSRDDFRADLIAGVTVGIVALPLAMAFAIASGVTPQAGIFTAIIAGFGLVLASLFFIYRVSELTRVEPITLDGVPPGIAAYKVFGSLFFGSVGRLEPLLDPVHTPARIVILEMHQVISIDNTGLETLQALARSLSKRGGQLILCGLNRHPAEQVARSGFRETLSADNVVPHLAAALFRAHRIVRDTTQPELFDAPVA